MSPTQTFSSHPSSPVCSPRRPSPERSRTWPVPTIHVVTEDGAVTAHISDSGSVSAVTQGKPFLDPFEEDLDEHPEDHFLSPVLMYEYEDWAEDSDDDAEEVEWDAGITDFALFDNDRRRAQDLNEELPSKWDGMLSSQAQALARAVERSRTHSDPEFLSGSPSDDSMPDLTPDSSPNLRDDLDIESFHGQSAARPSVPNYLTITITPPPEDGDIEDYFAVDDEEDYDEPLSFYVQRGREQRRIAAKSTKPERPGLRYSRTMSGKPHVWRRPSWDIYSLSEDPAAERNAELEYSDAEEFSGHDRGRRK